MTLPAIMVAPNGARRGKTDHAALPVTIGEIVETTLACKNAGAGGLHAHVRDAEGRHVLDAGLYSELLRECDLKLPGFYVQITTEAVGMYSPHEQDVLVRRVRPHAVSVALGEMAGGGDEKLARNFYQWADEAEIEVQHILYSPDELGVLAGFIKQGVICAGELQLLFVLGRYDKNQQSRSSDLMPFLDALALPDAGEPDWAVCAFGRAETDCLVKAAKLGGKVRVGFENSLWNRDGNVASDNAERVTEVSAAIGALKR